MGTGTEDENGGGRTGGREDGRTGTEGRTGRRDGDGPTETGDKDRGTAERRWGQEPGREPVPFILPVLLDLYSFMQ